MLLRGAPAAAPLRLRRAPRQLLRCASAMAAAPSDIAQLHYFHGRGRAEQARWMLAATGTPFRNVCLDTKADFARLNADGLLRFGQVPLLQLGGLNLVQSQAIVRHLARTHDLCGATHAEAAAADEAAEGVADFRAGLMGYPFSRDASAAAGCVRRYAPVFEALLAAAPSRCVAGGAALTYADVLLAEVVTGYEELFGDFCADGFPLLREHAARVRALPAVAAYLASPLRFPFPEGAVADAYVKNVGAVLRG